MKVFKRAFNDFKKYKDYIMFAVKSELKAEFSGSWFGYLWWVLDPLMYMLIYMLLVMVIFQRGDENFPIFVFCALIPWKWSVTTMINSISSIKGKSAVLQQVYTPKFIFPLIRMMIQTFKFFFGILVLLVLLLFFKIPYSLNNLGFFLVFIPQFLFLMGASFILAHVGVYFKDIRNIMTFSTRLWFYLSPGLYSLDRVPDKIMFVWLLNPMTTFFENYRNVFLYGKAPDYKMLIVWTIFSIILIYFGLRKLYIADKNYTKVI